MIHLLDVNVLIALGDSNHPHRAAALQFFEKCATLEGWASCPLTGSAFIRIFGAHSYPYGPGSTAEASVGTSIAHAHSDLTRAEPVFIWMPEVVSLSS